MAVILMIDDDREVLEINKKYLTGEGFDVSIASSAEQGIRLAKQCSPDCILLDVMMPDRNGYEVCHILRTFTSAPILFLTGKSSEDDKITGLTSGADDYIVKPFSLVELDARVRAHLRREARHNFEAQIKFVGDLTIDYSERCLFFNGKRVGLAKKEFDIVELLSQNPGQVFDKERIYEHIWGYDSEGDSSVVAEHIRRIRSKIAAYTDRMYIETVWGCGYKWVK